MDLIKIAEEAFATGKQHPSFKAGDTVTVAYRIVAIDSITVNKIGKVRRAKLYYLRKLTGKKARIQEKRAN